MSPRDALALPHFLATLYGLAIVYASLQPFANWMAPVAGAPYFLFAPWPPRWVRYDIVTNCAAYLPFGFFVGLVPRAAARLPVLLAISIGAGAILSLTMETLQMFVPTRDASVADLLANTAGAALGGASRHARSRARRTPRTR